MLVTEAWRSERVVLPRVLARYEFRFLDPERGLTRTFGFSEDVESYGAADE